MRQYEKLIVKNDKRIEAEKIWELPKDKKQIAKLVRLLAG